MLKILTELLYPRRCPICDDIVFPKGKLVCNSCRDILMPLHEPLCYKCGRQITSTGSEFCETCFNYNFNFDKAFSLWPYNNITKTSLARFKYKGRREFADYYADKLYEYFAPLISKLDISALIPVPIHPNRLITRGYNQANLISNILSKKLDLPNISDYLIRSKNTTAQKDLDPISRRKNLKNAFEINQNSKYYNIHLKNILLIDDIYTTGSTADSCSKILKDSGTEKVYVLCIASVRAM
ncbi:MAG: ComF family protein [Catonella sp.]|uniref:ComF family protein n=1 Tax=Catonella sp. TaxID=2382125 RepID=UPI003F9F87CE